MNLNLYHYKHGLALGGPLVAIYQILILKSLPRGEHTNKHLLSN
ncbi:hypothetical protein [Pontibacillus halophilus]|nr:hypothetical protein [Pontibacillus halophilus]